MSSTSIVTKAEISLVDSSAGSNSLAVAQPVTTSSLSDLFLSSHSLLPSFGSLDYRQPLAGSSARSSKHSAFRRLVASSVGAMFDRKMVFLPEEIRRKSEYLKRQGTQLLATGLLRKSATVSGCATLHMMGGRPFEMSSASATASFPIWRSALSIAPAWWGESRMPSSLRAR